MLWAANKLDAREQADAARQQHCEGPQSQPSLSAGAPSCGVPPRELPATALVVDVVEETALRHQQRVRLEWAFCRQIHIVANGALYFLIFRVFHTQYKCSTNNLFFRVINFPNSIFIQSCCQFKSISQ